MNTSNKLNYRTRSKLHVDAL